MKLLSIVGARPQFIKAAVISKVLRERHTEVLVHTGQHYDYTMSELIFSDLDLPSPDLNLNVGSGSHGQQTGTMLQKLEEVMQQDLLDWVLVYGDTNSTLAGALAASKLHIPVVHIEAGLRSFNRRMPEEINRVVTDHISDLLLCPSQSAAQNLANEGITTGVHIIGDIMKDALQTARQKTNGKILATLGVDRGGYLLATVHRAENTDDPARIKAILSAFDKLQEPLIFPVHPRTQKVLESLAYTPPEHVQLIDPVGYLDMLALQMNARMILTDSGGMQKEAYWLGVPCVTLRDETEWLETVETGWNVLVGADHSAIMATVQKYMPPIERPALYGDGEAANKCLHVLESYVQA